MRSQAVMLNEDFPLEPEVWVRPDFAPTVSLNAALGRHFRFDLESSATLRIDQGSSGALVLVRVRQPAAGGMTLGAEGIVFRHGETTLPVDTSASAATLLVFMYDEQAAAFEFFGFVTKTRGDALYDAIGAAAAAAAASQPLDSDLTAVAGLSTNGLVVRTATGAMTTRTIGAGSAKVTVTNGDGVAGAPSVDVATGSSGTTVCVGNDSRLSDARTPTGAAGGDLSGTYPNPTVASTGKNVTQCQWSVQGTFAGLTTYYASAGSLALSVTEYRWPVTRDSTVQRLYARLSTAPGAGNTVTVTMKKNGVDGAVTLVVADAATTGSDVTHSLSLSAGDTVSIKVETSVLNSAQNLTLSFELLPT